MGCAALHFVALGKPVLEELTNSGELVSSQMLSLQLDLNGEELVPDLLSGLGVDDLAGTSRTK